MQLDRLILAVADAERRLGDELEELANRHADEADLHYTARTLARGCPDHLAALQPAAVRYAMSTADVQHTRSPSVTGPVGQRVSSLVADAEVAGLALLADLRRTYLAAHEAEILWATVLQGAKAARDRELIGIVEAAQAHAARCAKWLRTRIKAAAAQALVAG